MPIQKPITLQEAKPIARHLGLTLRKVRSGHYRVNFRDGDESTACYAARIRSEATEFRYEREGQPLPKIGPWIEQIDELLLANEGKAARERLTLIRLFEELRGRGYDIAAGNKCLAQSNKHEGKCD